MALFRSDFVEAISVVFFLKKIFLWKHKNDDLENATQEIF